MLFKNRGENGFVTVIDDAVEGFSESLDVSSLSLCSFASSLLVYYYHHYLLILLYMRSVYRRHHHQQQDIPEC
jgi:hypothetical protein